MLDVELDLVFDVGVVRVALLKVEVDEQTQVVVESQKFIFLALIGR